MAGVFLPVVGPSGAGKDTLIDAARHQLVGDDRFHFVRRVITRPADAGGEQHVAATLATFGALEAAGGFALSWRAHDLAYGIPVSADGELANGRHVIANLSRGAIGAAVARYAAVCVLHVTAPAELLRARLTARQREDETSQGARLKRVAVLPDGVRVIEIVNDGSIELGAGRLLGALQAVAANGAR
ncbi:phosphonate metabolism protein/1,5-bisphosphokinase (PRPP-forming) PhnN [Sphingomonas sp. GlSt437]|uniref:phosphonate metabolism protein/1,5-bisphosphokinase (PRPP-forming) PhnN n=1 Tax=Sphingomonas sp. GlSt437 TaxID=3389970 RepID=UPI003A86AF03